MKHMLLACAAVALVGVGSAIAQDFVFKPIDTNKLVVQPSRTAADITAKTIDLVGTTAGNSLNNGWVRTFNNLFSRKVSIPTTQPGRSALPTPNQFPSLYYNNFNTPVMPTSQPRRGHEFGRRKTSRTTNAERTRSGQKSDFHSVICPDRVLSAFVVRLCLHLGLQGGYDCCERSTLASRSFTMRGRIPLGLSCLVALLITDPATAADPGLKAGNGTFKVDCTNDEKCGVAERYRMPSSEVEYQLSLRHDLKYTGVRVYNLTFPSPVKTDIPENNTVHCELFLPAGEGPVPVAIVLDILQGNALIARGQCMWLAQHGVAGMVVYMAHYGPRRPPDSKVRLISTDVFKSIDGVKQTVLDCRCAVAWLASQPEFDRGNIGLAGTSLGSLVGAVVSANEPLIKNVCLVLPAGGLVDAFYDHPKAEPYRPLVDAVGGKFTMKLIIAPVDPLTYAKQLKGKNLLMLCAARDDILPPSAAKRLWEATGKQRIVWFDTTHVGTIVYLLPLLQEMTDHIKGTAKK